MIINAAQNPENEFEYPVAQNTCCITVYRQLNMPIPPPIAMKSNMYALLVKHRLTPEKISESKQKC